MQNTERNSLQNKFTCSCTNNNLPSIFPVHAPNSILHHHHDQGTPVRSSVPTRGAKNGSPSEYSSTPMGTCWDLGFLDEGPGGCNPVPSYPVLLMVKFWPTSCDREQPCKAHVYPCCMLIHVYICLAGAPKQMPNTLFTTHERSRSSIGPTQTNPSRGLFCDDFNLKNYHPKPIALFRAVESKPTKPAWCWVEMFDMSFFSVNDQLRMAGFSNHDSRIVLSNPFSLKKKSWKLPENRRHCSSLSRPGPWKTSLNFLFPTKYGTPKSWKRLAIDWVR